MLVEVLEDEVELELVGEDDVVPRVLVSGPVVRSAVVGIGGAWKPVMLSEAELPPEALPPGSVGLVLVPLRESAGGIGFKVETLSTPFVKFVRSAGVAKRGGAGRFVPQT